MAAPYYESKAYQELVQAAHSRDYNREARIVQEQIAATAGPERAFWLSIRLGLRMMACVTPRDYMNLVPELTSLWSAAPDDPQTVESMAYTALNLCTATERNDALSLVLPMLRPHRHALAKDHGVRDNVARLQFKKRRWHSAYRNLSLAMEWFGRLPEAQQLAQGGYRYYQYNILARTAVALGRYDEAARSIQSARAIMTERPSGYFQPEFLALAEAALAHARGEYQHARTVLQTANIVPTTRIDQRRPPWVDVDFLLMAARIARSEGNLSSFHHFCHQARALCAEYDMPLSAATVEAVAQGAEY